MAVSSLRGAFTLIEMLVVIVILSVFAALATPRLFTMKDAATGRTVIAGGLPGNAHRDRIQDAINKKHYTTPEAQAPAVAEPAQSPDLAKFISAFGSLKGKGVFGDDAVEFQREMSEEWR